MHILSARLSAGRTGYLACLFASGFVILMLAGWSSPDQSAMSERLTRRDVGLHLGRALAASCAVELPPDLDTATDADLAPMIASGHMGLFPDGSFRPDVPMRIGEVLATWARVWKSFGDQAGPSGRLSSPHYRMNPRWRWSADSLSLLAEIDPDSAAVVAAASPDDPATRELWRHLPLPGSKRERSSETAAGKAPRTTGTVVDAITGKPIPGAVGTIDGKSFSTDADGVFRIPDGDSRTIRDVFVAVNGYRSLSLRWNRDLRPELKLSLKQFRASLDIRVMKAEGAPAADARVSLNDMHGCTTDDEGMARFRSIRPGYHQLIVDSPDGDTASMLISVAESGGIQTIRLPASSVR